MKRTIPGYVLILMLFMHAASVPAVDGEFYHQYADLLQTHVADGMVDYHGFKKDEALLDQFLDRLDQTDPEQLLDDERLAFYINAYNSYTVKLILDNFTDNGPPSSIKKIGTFFTSPWKISFAKINGKSHTLDEIEHDIIRRQWNEPRIHFAVNCASLSCPPLIPEPYRAADIDAQLERVTRAFLNDPARNYLEGDMLYVSSIFKWYGGDFDDDPLQFFLAHTDGDFQAQLVEGGKTIKVKYLDYDWSLNGVKR